MSRSNFQTPKEYREELLKQSLMQEAAESKPYYEDGFYKPSTIIQAETRKQGDFYDDIDQIGLRIASPEYQEKSRRGLAYVDETEKMGKNLIDDLVNQVKQGVMSSEVYNNIIAYFVNTVRTAWSGEAAERRGRTMGSTEQILENVIAQNITSLSGKEVEKLEKELGLSKREIAAVLARARREAQIPPQGIDVQNGGNASFSDDRPNIANPKVQLIDSENPVYGNTHEKLDRVQEITSEDTNQPNLQGDQHSAMSRIDLTGENAQTQDFGLGFAPSVSLNALAGGLVKSGLNAGWTPAQFDNAIKGLAADIKGRNPQFALSTFINSYNSKYSQDYVQGKNEDASHKTAAGSAGALQMEEYKQLLDDDADINTRQNQGTHPFEKYTGAAQMAAGKLSLSNQLANSINGASNLLKSYFFGPIMDGKLPATFPDELRGTDGEYQYFSDRIDSDLEVMDIFNQTIARDPFSGNSFDDNLLKKIKDIFSPASLRAVYNAAKDIDLEQYADEDDFDISPEEEKKLLLKLLDDTIKTYDANVEKNVFAWAIKDALSSSYENPQIVFSKFKKDLENQKGVRNTQPTGEMSAKGKPKPKQAKRGGTRYDAKEYYQQGAPARTNDIPDPPMRYTVEGGRKQKVCYDKRNPHNIVIS